MRNNYYYKQASFTFRYRVLTPCALLIIFTFAANVTFAAAGNLDSSFDFNGKLKTDYAYAADQAFAVTVQPNGKIIAAGTAYIGDEGFQDFLVVRYNSNGSLDNTFGELDFSGPNNENRSGIARVDFGSSIDIAYAVTYLSDGKILVAGTSNVGDGGNQNFALVRLNSNGENDLTFGVNGRVEIDFGSPNILSIDECRAMSVQSNGKIVLAGSTVYPGDNLKSDFAVARLNADGSTDNTFDGNGKLRTDYLRHQNVAFAVAVQSDGKTVVAGSTTSNDGGAQDSLVVRYNLNGSLDSAFGNFSSDGSTRTGIFDTDFTGYDAANAVKILSNGKILVAGYSTAGTTYADFSLIRLNPGGNLDLTFGTSGRVNTDFLGAATASNDTANAMEIQADGKILLAGLTQPVFTSGGENFALARYNSNGSLDASFNSGGKLTTDLSGNYDIANAIALQPDGKIVLAGEGFFSDTGSLDFALARYLAR